MKKILNGLIIVLVLYPLGMILGITFTLLRLLGRIEIRNRHHFPPRQKNMIVVANHPSFLEPVLLPVLFFSEYLRNPFLLPWSTPDIGLVRSIILFWLGPRAIPVDRSESATPSRVKSFRRMIKILKEDGRIILFSEGGRTFKQKEWLVSGKGKKLGKISEGVAFLALKSNSLVLPVWIDGAEDVLPNNKFPWPRFWRGKVVIKIGQPLRFVNITSHGATKKLSQILLDLADE